MAVSSIRQSAHHTQVNGGETADLSRLKLKLATMIENSLDHQHLAQGRTPALTNLVRQRLQSASQHKNLMIPVHLEEQFFNEVVDEVIGFGPIESLLSDDSVTEVMVNGPGQVYVERSGKLTLTEVYFQDDAHVERVINKIVRPLGRRVDAKSPLVDARLPDGSRVNAIVPPCAIDGPSITIRKFAKNRLTIDDLVNYSSLTEDMAQYLEACVKSKLNIIISGGTGSGKTTLLNVLSSYIPDTERIVTIEDAAELNLNQRHVVRLETRHADALDERDVSIRELVRNSLRMRPERIVVGECRGSEALDMLQAMNTGHDGSLTTVHANTPRDTISRLETLIMMAGMDIPVEIVRKQIASAIQLIVQQARLRDGSRKVTHITEVAGMEGSNVVMQDVFKFEEGGEDSNGKVMGEFGPTGMPPFFSNRLKNHGFNLPSTMFMKARNNGSFSRR